MQLNLDLTVLEVSKIDLKAGETLMVTIKSDEVDQYTAEMIQKSFSRAFPQNKVAVISLGSNDSVEYTKIKDESATQPEENAPDQPFCDNEKKCEECVCDSGEPSAAN